MTLLPSGCGGPGLSAAAGKPGREEGSTKGDIDMGVDIPATPQLPFKMPHIPTSRDHKALNRGPLGGLGIDAGIDIDMAVSINWGSLKKGLGAS